MFVPTLFQDKVILVTGGRSGIGYAIAASFLAHGAKVYIASRKKEALEKAALTLGKKGPCHGIVCDIRSTKDIDALATQIKQQSGRLDILINNAGGQFPAPAHVMAEKGWAAVINNNLNGTFYMCQKMANTFFIPQNNGNIVNITANVIRGFPGMAHTGAARAGVENLTKSLGQEWATYNIRVNAVAPGTIDTSGLDNYPPFMQDFFRKSEAKNLMKRFGKAEDVANAVLFLSSPLAAYISGITLAVDGLEHLAGDRMEMYNALMKMMQ
ncbi:MAG: SDR family oxidoreductase [Flavobacteriaceae bacterium]